ncbi:MAG: hypothetical protein DDT39_00045 [Firmicutes bacterium]|nr:hypothetical protein [candidate division NPL-UPA2 bacterium]
MTARWVRLKDLIDIAPSEVLVSEPLNAAGNWVARSFGGFMGAHDVQTISFGALAPQMWNASVRARLVADLGSAADLHIYPASLRLVVPSVEYGVADVSFGSFALTFVEFSPPLILTPNPAVAQAPIPLQTHTIAAVLFNSAVNTNGWGDLHAEFDFEFFGDFALGSFWTDFINSRTGA